MYILSKGLQKASSACHGGTRSKFILSPFRRPSSRLGKPILLSFCKQNKKIQQSKIASWAVITAAWHARGRWCDVCLFFLHYHFSRVDDFHQCWANFLWKEERSALTAEVEWERRAAKTESYDENFIRNREQTWLRGGAHCAGLRTKSPRTGAQIRSRGVNWLHKGRSRRKVPRPTPLQ